ncbi:MAG: hypothetical protein WCA79_05195 [Anaerolineales bacterium]
METLENLGEKAGSLSPAEKLLLASRLIKSVRQRDLSDSFQKSQREALKKSLEKLAKMKVFADIKDPVKWQSQIRKDRPLPRRDA